MKSPWARATIALALTVMAVALYWAQAGSLVFNRHSGSAGPDHLLRPGSGAATPAAGSHMTIAETAALAVLGGIQPPRPRRLPVNSHDPKVQAAAGLVTKLETGGDAEAVEAIRGLAALGGERNIAFLAAVMNDDAGWSDVPRTEAALALLNTGNEQDTLTAIRGLSVIGGDANTDRLAAMANDPSLPQSQRLAAALGLGTIGTPLAGAASFGPPPRRARTESSVNRGPSSSIRAPSWT